MLNGSTVGLPVGLTAPAEGLGVGVDVGTATTAMSASAASTAALPPVALPLRILPSDSCGPSASFTCGA